MATYNSDSTEEPGQYPATTAFTAMGLPAQDFGTGAGGSSQPSATEDSGGTNEPGEYPDRMPFVGTPLGDTGAPGSQGSAGSAGQAGPDRVTYTEWTPFKGAGDDYAGQETQSINATVSGPGDWTQAHPGSYGGGPQLPGIEGNMPIAGEGPYQPGGGRVRRGGFMNGQR